MDHKFSRQEFTNLYLTFLIQPHCILNVSNLSGKKMSDPSERVSQILQ